MLHFTNVCESGMQNVEAERMEVQNIEDSDDEIPNEDDTNSGDKMMTM